MKTIYSLGNGKYLQLDSYGETHKSYLCVKAVLASLVLALMISSIAGLVSKYAPLDPQIIKGSRAYVTGY